jgi:hypothetical protein
MVASVGAAALWVTETGAWRGIARWKLNARNTIDDVCPSAARRDVKEMSQYVRRREYRPDVVNASRNYRRTNRLGRKCKGAKTHASGPHEAVSAAAGGPRMKSAKIRVRHIHNAYH